MKLQTTQTNISKELNEILNKNQQKSLYIQGYEDAKNNQINPYFLEEKDYRLGRQDYFLSL